MKNVENKIEGLDGLLVMSIAGQRGGHAVAKVISGEVNPSGKLVDSWAADYWDYPSSAGWGTNDLNTVEEDYTDDIYVGYRYFDTFGREVAYPFGYGLSYSEFAISDVNVSADEKEVTVTATVTNTGECSGKEVVEVYYSAPVADSQDALTADLEIPYQELAAYAKTDELEPGQSQELKMSYPTTQMASYSEKNAAYVLGAGAYVIRVGNSSRNTTASGLIEMPESVITQQLTNRMPIDEEIELLSRSDSEGTLLNKDEAELAGIEAIALDAAEFTTETIAYSDGKYFDSDLGKTVAAVNEVPVYVTDGVTETNYLIGENGTAGKISYYYETDVTPAAGVDENGVVYSGENNPEDDILVEYQEKLVDVSAEGATRESTLKDVADGKISMEAFVSTLTLEEMSNLVNGTLVSAENNTDYSVLGGAGDSNGQYMEDKYIVNLSMADGPTGLRIRQDCTENVGTESYQYVISWPCETLIAQSWDTSLALEVGQDVGAEMEKYGVSLWLAHDFIRQLA